jgi:AsmA protein
VAGALTIRNGTIILDNPLHPYGPASVELTNIHLDVPDPLSSHPLRIRMSGRLPGKTSSSFDLDGSVQRNEADHTSIEVELHMRDLEAARLASAMGISGAAAATFTGTLDFEGKAVGEWPRLALTADADLQRIGVMPAKDTGKTIGEKARLRAQGRWEGEALDLSDVSLLWKGHTIAGRLHLVTQKSPRLQFWLNTPELSIEPIMALATATAGGADQTNTPRASRPPSPSRLREGDERGREGGLQVEGHLRSDVLRWGKLVLTTAENDLHYCCGLFTLRRLRGGFYGGTLSSDAAVDWRGPTPRVTVVTHLEGVQTESLLSAIQEPKWTVQGVMTLDSKIEFSGQLRSGALGKVSGQSDIAMTNGRVTGYAPLERLSKTVDPILKGLGMSPLTLNEFDRLSAHWTLDGGILRTRDLTLLRDGTKFYIAGSYNLLNQTMDFDVTAKVAKTTLEAKVHGPSSDPVVTPQAGSIEGRIKTEVGRLLGKDRNKELGKMLQQLFSR